MSYTFTTKKGAYISKYTNKSFAYCIIFTVLKIYGSNLTKQETIFQSKNI